MKQRYYLIIALVSYLLFTLMNTPAATVISLAQKNISMPVKFYGVQGSIWNGQADRVMMPSKPPLDNLQWSLNPLALLLLSLSADIEAQIKQQRIVGNINIGVSGNISASGVRAQLNAADVQRMLAMPFGELGGEFNLDIKSLQWSGTGLPLASGKIIWKNARLTMVESVDLGMVELDISPGEDDQLLASINNKNGQISISGDASLMSDRRYTVDLNFNPQNNASNNVKQSLGMFARRQSNGSYTFKKSGNLNQLGF
jgi:hypothetical protein